jgi:hypothetical protein
VLEADECPSRVCPADLTRDGYVSTEDLLFLLAVFNRVNCDAELSLYQVEGVPPGTINTEDLLVLLAEFGRHC